MTVEQIKNSLERRNFKVFPDELGNLSVHDESQSILIHVITDKWYFGDYEEKITVNINVGVPQTNCICEKWNFNIDQNCDIREFEHKLSQVLEDIANSITKVLNQWQEIVDDVKSLSDNLYNNVK